MDGKEVPYEKLLEAIEGVPGVVTHGLFHRAASAAILAAPDGPVLLPLVNLSARHLAARRQSHKIALEQRTHRVA